MTKALGYVRVSTDEQAENGGGLDAQRSAIIREAQHRDWELVDIIGEDAGASGKSLERVGLQRAIAKLDKRQADVLVVSKLDRLSRDLVEGLQVMKRAQRKGWSVVALDVGVDTSTPSGEMFANINLTFAQYERRIIGQRTADGMRAKKAAGTLKGTIGRPQSLPDDVLRRILGDRAAGLSYGKIAKALNEDGVPTGHGGAAWYPSTVKRVCESSYTHQLWK
jgi:DNA invertase Pin-like site-specific DNA recombinase